MSAYCLNGISGLSVSPQCLPECTGCGRTPSRAVPARKWILYGFCKALSPHHRTAAVCALLNVFLAPCINAEEATVVVVFEWYFLSLGFSLEIYSLL